MKYPQLVSMPSAISDWLEEQLEARGIDSEVYTRYILSLLHSHSLDVLYPEDDLTFSGAFQKDGGRSAVSNKRLRRTGTWWRHVHADAEQIKRSAAVECLMSAAEQSCEIESLVDELCEKLKQVNSVGDISSTETNQETKPFQESSKQQKISSKELAEKYYEAFPPLNHKEGNSHFSTNINLVVGKWPSDKNNIDLIATKWTTSGSPKKTKRNAKRQFYEATMKPTSKTGQIRNKFRHKRAHCGKSLSKEMAENITNWELVCNNDYDQFQDQCLDSMDPTMMMFPEDVDMSEINDNDYPVCRMNTWLKNADSEKDYRINKYNSAVKRSRLYEKNAKYLPLYHTTIWSDNEEQSNYEWTVGATAYQYNTSEKDTSWLNKEECAIREEYQRTLKEEECAIKEEYDRQRELDYHEAAATNQNEINFNDPTVRIGETFTSNISKFGLCQTDNDAIEFGLVTPDDLKKQDDEFTRQNYANGVLEDLNRALAQVTTTRPSNEDSVSDCNEISNMLLDLFDKRTISYMVVNHSLDSSAFREYHRPLAMNIDVLPLGPISRPFGRPMNRPCRVGDMTPPPLKLPVAPIPLKSDQQKGTSPHMYFEPIKTVPQVAKEAEGNPLKDGATFNISGSIDEVKFQRSTTGSLILETESGEVRKYYEYKWRPPSDESVKLPRTRKSSECEEFRIKYWVSPNDKSCQTIDAPPLPLGQNTVDVKMDTSMFKELTDSGFFNSKFEAVEKEEDLKCETPPDKGTLMVKSENFERPNSLCETDEVIWGYDPKSSEVFCKHCNVKHPWPNNNALKTLDNIDWDERALKHIWGGTETCGTCLWSTKVPTPLEETTTKLREESKEEAERLLSDLSSLQLSFSTRVLEAQFNTDEGPSEKKRRHSYMNNDTTLWSFTTRLQEDCLISLSTLPTRRSVTL